MRLISVTFFAVLTQIAPLSAQSLSLEDGQALFINNCSACHGEDAGGGNSPDIRGSTPNDVYRVRNGFEDMPAIELSDEERDAIGRWLSTLD